jgi:hypothetical protein
MINEVKSPMDFQENIITLLKHHLSSNNSLVDVISDLLNISQDAAYRRIRGEKRFNIDELFIICSTYDISLDTIFSVKSNGSIFNYTSLDVGDFDNYLMYMKKFSKSIELVKDGKDKEIIISAIDIPVFHFMPYKELTLFKLFAWTNTVYKYDGNFLSFVKKYERPDLFNCYDKIASDYSRIPSTEVWTTNTIDTILRLLDFYVETGYFPEQDIPLLLCHQLLQLIEKLKVWVEKGYKENPLSTFRFYVSDTDLENNFVLLRKDNVLQCLIKLFTINSLSTSDENFCKETQNWLESSINRAVLLSGASERDRFRYFNTLQQKVHSMIDKLEKYPGQDSPVKPISSFKTKH